uniref:Nucleolar protein 16 n=1 Tax=Strongyloides venezuelensis TaxID=75913 RepID=A0A0K0FK03_STRVS
MRSIKSVKRNCITKHAYKNKSHKKQAAKKAMLACKEWKKSTYSNCITNKCLDLNEIIKSNTIYGNAPEPKSLDNQEKVTFKVNNKKNKNINNTLSVDVNSNGQKNAMKPSVDSGVVTNLENTSRSSSPASQISTASKSHPTYSNSFFESVTNFVQTAVNSVSGQKTYPGLKINHSGGRRGNHKLSPRDIKFCANMLDKYGEDYTAISKSEDNVYMDTARGIERKIKLFKESPEYELYKKAKEEGKSFEGMLAAN